MSRGPLPDGDYDHARSPFGRPRPAWPIIAALLAAIALLAYAVAVRGR